MSDPVWLTVAKGLPAGGHTKIACCRADRSMIVNNGNKGFSAHCFRCGDREFVPHGQHSISQLAQRQAELRMMRDKTVALPADFTFDIPAAEAVWLYKASISREVARHYGIGWSPTMQRVIVPVRWKGELDGYTARSTSGKPKYLEKSKRPSSLLFMADPTIRLPSTATDTSTFDLVFTEDILSAIRVGRCIRGRVCSTLGTDVSPAALHRALTGLTGPLRVAVWMDPDDAGRSGAAKAARDLRLQGHNVEVIESRADPKLLTNEEIRRLLT